MKVLEVSFLPASDQVRLTVRIEKDQELLELLRGRPGEIVAWRAELAQDPPNGHAKQRLPSGSKEKLRRSPQKPFHRGHDSIPGSVPCPQCPRKFGRANELAVHVRAAHSQRPGDPPPKKNGPLVCVRCGIRLSNPFIADGKSYCSSHAPESGP
jgi:hypothetical protein